VELKLKIKEAFAKPTNYIINQTTPYPLLVKEGSYGSYLIILWLV
jgi:hypothetical protein